MFFNEGASHFLKNKTTEYNIQDTLPKLYKLYLKFTCKRWKIPTKKQAYLPAFLIGKLS